MSAFASFFAKDKVRSHLLGCLFASASICVYLAHISTEEEIRAGHIALQSTQTCKSDSHSRIELERCRESAEKRRPKRLDSCACRRFFQSNQSDLRCYKRQVHR